MSQEATQEFIELMRKRYQEAVKFKKTWILDQVCEILGFSRDHARKVLTGRSRNRRRNSGPPKIYGALVCKHVVKLWEKMGRMCSKRMRAALPVWLPHYHEGDCTDEVKAQLQAMSAATIDRILKPFRIGPRKGLSSTRAGHLIKNRIPLKVLGEIIEKPGFVEADTVAHCGNSLGGEFIYSLTLTDLASGWTENRALWNKKSHEVLRQLKDIEEHIPFELYGFSSDNGTEFLNQNLIDHFVNESRKIPVQMSRGRAYKKNDNPHVEQRNYTHVRQLLGYYRYDQKEWVDLINEIYKKYWNPLKNYFHPCIKLTKKERLESKIIKVYDEPRTPYQRLLRSHHISVEKKRELQKTFKSLDPFELQNKLAQSIKHLHDLFRKSREGNIAA